MNPTASTTSAYNGTIPSLQMLCADIVTCSTQPDISQCNQHICNILLDKSIKNNQLRLFRILLETWPHEETHITLDGTSLHYLQSLAILEHQRVISRELKKIYIHAPYAGYVSTNVLCSAAIGILEDYSCVVGQVKQAAEQYTHRRKRQRIGSGGRISNRTLKIYTPLNVNSTNIKTILRYMRMPVNHRCINVIPNALIFTSVQSALIFKALDLIDACELKMLGIDFSLQSDEQLDADEHIPILNKFTDIRSISLTYNYLKGNDKEQNLINSIKSMPQLQKINLSGNNLKEHAHYYVSSTMRELVLGNVYPTNESLKLIGETCGKSLQHIKLSDNGMNTRIPGLWDLMKHCKSLRSIDLSGNQITTLRETISMLRAVRQVEQTLESLTLSHNMFKENERMIVISEMSKFANLRELFLGPYLPDLLLSEDIIKNERRILSDNLRRPDIVMVFKKVNVTSLTAINN